MRIAQQKRISAMTPALFVLPVHVLAIPGAACGGASGGIAID